MPLVYLLYRIAAVEEKITGFEMELYVVYSTKLVEAKAWLPFSTVSMECSSTLPMAEADLEKFYIDMVQWLKDVPERALISCFSQQTQEDPAKLGSIVNIYQITCHVSFRDADMPQNKHLTRLKALLNRCATGCNVVFQIEPYRPIYRQTIVDFCITSAFLAQHLDFYQYLEFLGVSQPKAHFSATRPASPDENAKEFIRDSFRRLVAPVMSFRAIEILKNTYSGTQTDETREKFRLDLSRRLFNETVFEEIEEALSKELTMPLSRLSGIVLSACEKAPFHDEHCNTLFSLYGLSNMRSSPYVRKSHTLLTIDNELYRCTFLYMCMYEYIWLVLQNSLLDSVAAPQEEGQTTKMIRGSFASSFKQVLTNIYHRRLQGTQDTGSGYMTYGSSKPLTVQTGRSAVSLSPFQHTIGKMKDVTFMLKRLGFTFTAAVQQSPVSTSSKEVTISAQPSASPQTTSNKTPDPDPLVCNAPHNTQVQYKLVESDSFTFKNGHPLDQFEQIETSRLKTKSDRRPIDQFTILSIKPCDTMFWET